MYALANTQNSATIEYIKICNHNCSDNIDREHPPQMSKKIAGAIKLHSKVVMKENIFKSSKKYFSEKNSCMCSAINKLQWLDKSKYYLIKEKSKMTILQSQS